MAPSHLVGQSKNSVSSDTWIHSLIVQIRSCLTFSKLLYFSFFSVIPDQYHLLPRVVLRPECATVHKGPRCSSERVCEFASQHWLWALTVFCMVSWGGQLRARWMGDRAFMLLPCTALKSLLPTASSRTACLQVVIA